jgi:DNA gyrase subunit A
VTYADGIPASDSAFLELLLVTENGFGKRVAMNEYPTQGRGTGGVTTLHRRYREQTGLAVAGLVVQAQDEVTFITGNGMALHTEVARIPQAGRSARGQIVMNVLKGDRLTAVARMSTDADGQEDTRSKVG